MGQRTNLVSTRKRTTTLFLCTLLLLLVLADYVKWIARLIDPFVLSCGIQFPRHDAIIKRDVSIRSAFCTLRVGVQYRSLWQYRPRSNNASSSSVACFVFKRYRYENQTPALRPELCPLAYYLRDGRYSKLKRTYPAVLDDYYWTPATLFSKIILLVCHDIPIYCYSCNNVASRQILA